jgi:uncharacterized protein related to proFAR isomerase
MEILPAIDLREGKCVRLLQGDYARQIDYADDPIAQAKGFERDGAKWLHIVDLDGALHGMMRNAAVIEKIARATSLKIEVGGGIRDEKAVQQLLDLGVAQAIIGTRALEDFDWFESLVSRFASAPVPLKISIGLNPWLADLRIVLCLALMPGTAGFQPAVGRRPPTLLSRAWPAVSPIGLSQPLFIRTLPAMGC